MKDQFNQITSNLNFIKKLFDSVLTVPSAAREFDKRLVSIFSAINTIEAAIPKLRGAKLIPFTEFTSIGRGLRNGAWAKSKADLNDPLVRELIDALFRVVSVTEGNQGLRALSAEQVQQVIDEAYSFASRLAQGEDPRLEAARADAEEQALRAGREMTLAKALEAGSFSKAAGASLDKAGQEVGVGRFDTVKKATGALEGCADTCKSG